MSCLDMLTDAEFLAQFRAGTLDPREFDHRGHVRAGWLYLTQLPTEVAIERLAEDIQRYATGLGAAGKFHRTITEALMRLLASHLPHEKQLSWEQLLERHPIILNDARGLLLRFYSESQLASPEARTQFVPPDRRPIPTD